MLSELVANNPSHSQREADCGGLSSQRTAVAAGAKSSSETCGKLEMWNNDFYWALSKQTHIRLDPGPRAWLIGITHLFITPHGDFQQSSLHQCWWRAQPSPSLNITLPVAFQEFRKGDISERGLGDGLHMTANRWERIQRTLTLAHFWNTLRVTFQDTISWKGNPVLLLRQTVSPQGSSW